MPFLLLLIIIAAVDGIYEYNKREADSQSDAETDAIIDLLDHQ